MHPRLINSVNSCGSNGGIQSKPISVVHNGSSCSTDEWVAMGRNSMPPKSAANLKSLNEAIQAERVLSRQKIINAEEKILELEHKLILKEKECCDLKERLLYEHQRQTMDMAHNLLPSYYREPEPMYSEPSYFGSKYPEPYSDRAGGEPNYGDPTLSYEHAVKNNWAPYPNAHPDSIPRSLLSADAKEFTTALGHNPTNLVTLQAPALTPSGQPSPSESTTIADYIDVVERTEDISE